MVLFSYLMLITGGFTNMFGSYINILGLFIAFCWSAPFNGPTLNPAIVIALIFKKETRVHPFKAAAYIIFQFIGTAIGTTIAWASSEYVLLAPFMGPYHIWGVVQVFLRQMVGSFIYCTVLFILISTDITFVEINLQVWLAAPILLMTSCQISHQLLGLNPAFGWIFQLGWCVYYSDYSYMKYCWASVLGPIVGSLFAVFFFEFFYRGVAFSYKTELKKEEDMIKERIAEAEREDKKFLRRGTEHSLELV